MYRHVHFSQKGHVAHVTYIQQDLSSAETCSPVRGDHSASHQRQNVNYANYAHSDLPCHCRAATYAGLRPFEATADTSR